MNEQVLKYTEYRWRYRVEEDIVFHTGILGHSVQHEFFALDQSGVLLIKKGYAWNGANRPAINTKSFRRGSLVHDVLIQMVANRMIPTGCLPRIHQFLVEICLKDHMWPVRTYWVYWAVSRWGRARPSREPLIQSAP